MDHPLVDLNQKDLRQRVVHLLKTSYQVRRSSNIIFVCGGNNDADMRMKFREYSSENLNEFDIFFPEYAMENIFSSGSDEPFDIADFEELISELSHAIVIFPEAAGSYAETGYFSAIDKISKRCILALNSQYQAQDSFISLGPAKKIGANSIFHPLVQIDYENPDFQVITDRIRRIDQRRYKKHLSFEAISDVSTYELSCVVHQIINIHSVATVDDVLNFCKVLFRNRFLRNRIRKILSVLVGAQYLVSVGEFGHFRINKNKQPLLELRDGHAEPEREARLQLASLYQDCERAFQLLLEEPTDVA